MVTISPEFDAFLTPDRQDYIIGGGRMEAAGEHYAEEALAKLPA
jgi:hypothetical protein